MIDKKSKKVKFIFDERSLTTLENMTGEDLSGDKFTEITLRNPETGEEKIVFIPRLSERENAPDKKLRYGEVIRLLGNEHSWCVAHPENVNPVFRDGFMAGIQQAIRLITKLVQLEQIGYMGDYGGPGCDPVDR